MILEKELFEFTAKELVKIYAKNFYYIQRSMKARERKAEQLKNKGGWKYVENTSYNLFKEMLSPDKMLDMSRNDILHLVKISQTIMQDKHHTLSGTEEQIKKWMNEEIKPSVVFVDPPRKGCDKVFLETIVEMNINKVVYISCDPATLARDLKYLIANDYELKTIKVVDLFPHTSHVETIAYLIKK